MKMFFQAFVLIFAFFLGDSIPHNRPSDSLVNDDLEGEVRNFLELLRKDNAEVLNASEHLLKATQVAKVLELTKDLPKEFSISRFASDPDIDSHPDNDKLVTNILRAFKLIDDAEFFVYIPPLSAVEASKDEGPSKVVTNALVDANHTVEYIQASEFCPKCHGPDCTLMLCEKPERYETILEPEKHEDLFTKLGELAERYATGLGKTVQLIPLVTIDNSLRIEKYYKEFGVALVENNDGTLKALAALGIKINDRDRHDD